MKCDFTNARIYFSKCMSLLSLYCPNNEKATVWLEGMTIFLVYRSGADICGRGCCLVTMGCSLFPLQGPSVRPPESPESL